MTSKLLFISTNAVIFITYFVVACAWIISAFTYCSAFYLSFAFLCCATSISTRCISVFTTITRWYCTPWFSYFWFIAFGAVILFSSCAFLSIISHNACGEKGFSRRKMWCIIFLNVKLKMESWKLRGNFPFSIINFQFAVLRHRRRAYRLLTTLNSAKFLLIFCNNNIKVYFCTRMWRLPQASPRGDGKNWNSTN